MFLATTADQRFWKTDKPILFLGEWCKLYSQKSTWLELSHQVMPYPWDNRQDMYNAVKYERKFYEEALDILTIFLNKVHGENHNTKYWRIIIGPWLLYYIQVIHERYTCLKYACDLYSPVESIGLAESSFRIPINMLDFNDSCSGDVYNLQLYTILLDQIGCDIEKRAIINEYNFDKNTQAGLVKRFEEVFKKGLLRWSQNSKTLMTDIYLPLHLIAKLVIATGFSARWCKFPETAVWLSKITVDDLHPSRHDLIKLEMANMDSFKRIFMQTLPYNLPLLYLEGYQISRKWGLNFGRANKIKKIVTANASIFNEAFKFVVADSTEKGAQLVLIQHGGGYGSTKYYPNEILERSIADEYWTWGWGEEDVKIKAMPHPILSNISSMRNLTGKDSKVILYVGNSNLRYRLTNISSPMGNQILDYINWQIRFLKAINGNVNRKLLFRPYPFDRDWYAQKRIDNAIENLNFDTYSGKKLFRKYRDIYYKLLNASLVICDMNQTTFLETLALNIPLIVFLNPKYEEFRSSAEPYFEDLRRVQILHDSPESAANRVNQIADDPMRWWMTSEVQSVRGRFCQRFVRTSENWLKEWISRL